MSESYAVLAEIYDILNAEIDYDLWADYIEACFNRYQKRKIELVLDLACGTGKMSTALATRGYDMIGIDISENMLSYARQRAEEEGIDNLLLLCQDMRNFELYGTVDAVVCCLDGINHLTENGDLAQCLASIHNYLVPGGLFVFDVNSPYKFEKIYADNAYIFEGDNFYCGWQNYYNPKSRLCDFYISVFTPDNKGGYTRADAHQRERMYTERALKTSLTKAGFELLCLSGGYDFSPPAEVCERFYITARRI
ncbi:MAG: class I SAM-dependent methyltransferase [Clostridiales bacterium]|nr:class I SAM-dependent methyltransferase [Clostridiales bacterium]